MCAPSRSASHNTLPEDAPSASRMPNSRDRASVAYAPTPYTPTADTTSATSANASMSCICNRRSAIAGVFRRNSSRVLMPITGNVGSTPMIT